MGEIMKELIVLDFDHTIIDKNADTYINKLAPCQKIPDDVANMYTSKHWTPYMKEVFKFLYENGTKQDDYLKCMAEIPFVTGMMDLLLKLKEVGTYDIIIISDANSVFIERVLQNAGIRHVVKKVFTNPAHFDARGCLQLQEYHIQEWCTLSSRNLCKGSILENYVKEQKQNGIDYQRISYIGDGSNDYCPAIKLSESDLIFPRKGYKLLEKIRSTPQEVKAKVHPWETGYDILNILLSM